MTPEEREINELELMLSDSPELVKASYKLISDTLNILVEELIVQGAAEMNGDDVLMFLQVAANHWQEISEM